MALPLWGPLHELGRALLAAAGARLAGAIATTALSVVAAGFFVAAGFDGLMRLIGFPAAALAFGGVFAVLALAVHLWGRRAAARQSAQAAAARTRAEADIALATALGRSARPLLPLAAFLTAFVLTRRS